jgi:hypothetical protein
MQMRPPLYIGATTLKVPWKGVFEVERWKGGMVERFPRNKAHQSIHCVITGKP